MFSWLPGVVVCDYRKAHDVVEKKNSLLEVELIEIKVKHGCSSVANLNKPAAPQKTTSTTPGLLILNGLDPAVIDKISLGI